MEDYEKKMIEQPMVTVDDFYNEEKVLVIHSHINYKGKMISVLKTTNHIQQLKHL